MSTEPNSDADVNIEPESLNPPVWQGRALVWSGEDSVDTDLPGRVPELGECVRYCSETEFMPFGVVVGYFQAHGFLGVQLRLNRDGFEESICVFGAEILVSPGKPPEGKFKQ